MTPAEVSDVGEEMLAVGDEDERAPPPPLRG